MEKQSFKKVRRLVYDIESYTNLFTATFRDYDADLKFVFEISERKNQLMELGQFLESENILLIGFNSIHYDDIVLNCAYQMYKRGSMIGTFYTTRRLKYITNLIISGDESKRSEYLAFMYNKPWKSIDLFMYWSKMLRISKKLSLKSLAINLNWRRIQELPFPHDAEISEEDIDKVLDYNDNDVLITKELCKKMSNDINLRYEAKKKYGLPCENWDGVKLGLNILLKRYCDRTGKDIEYVKKLRSPRESIALKEIILDEIKFKKGDERHVQTIVEGKILNTFYSPAGLLKYLKNLVVTDTNEINCRLYYNDTVYDIKSGGLHSVHNPDFVVRVKGYKYDDIDVSSYYPTFGAMWRFVPEHLDDGMAEELDEIRLTRIDLKEKGLGKSPEADLLKLAMNGGFYGNTNNEYTAMYDPKAMLSITINGQLFLIMLAEMLNEIGVKIDMANTDGLTLYYPEEIEDQVSSICRQWEQISRCQLEKVEYEKVARMNINNYLAVFKNGKTKEKGQFLSDPPIDMSRDFLVIAKAVNNFIITGQDVGEFIRNHNIIYDFCSSQKVDKKFKVFWNGKEQQKLNRYYVSKKGAYLYKSPDGKTMNNMLKGFAVQLFNDFVEKSDYGIQYEYYISKAKEEINKFLPLQTTLF